MMRYLIAILLFSITISGNSVYSQNETSGGSAYSIFGIGDLSYYSSTRTYAMGILGTSLTGNYINSFNPAAITKLRSTLISTNFNYGFLKSSNDISENKVSNGNVLGINIGIPFDQGRGWVLGLGFNPASLINYKIRIQNSIGGANYNQTYSGSGGLSRINFGMSYNLLRKINIGLEYNYSFGEIKNLNYIDFNNSSYTNSLIKKETDFQKSYIKAGLILEAGKLFNSIALRNLNIGFVYQSGFNLNSTLDGIYISSTSVDTVRLKEGEIEIPDSYSFGITNNFGGKYIVSADIILQDWSKFRDFGKTIDNFGSSYRAGLGIEILPSRTNNSFWGRNTYRIGGFYDKAYYTVSGKDILTYGIRAGLNIPISKYNSLDFGINYSVKGKTSDGLIKDEFLNLTAGVNFGELWFLRPREEDK